MSTGVSPIRACAVWQAARSLSAYLSPVWCVSVPSATPVRGAQGDGRAATERAGAWTALLEVWITVSSRALNEACPNEPGARFALVLKETAVKDKELMEVLRKVTKVLSNSGMKQGHRDQLQSAKRELMAVAASGKLEKARVFRAVDTIATVMLEMIEDDAR